jgi:hypothetical protein
VTLSKAYLTVLALASAHSWLMAGEVPVQWKVPPAEEGKPAGGYPILKGVKTHLIYHATPETGMFSHHAQIAFHNGSFFASWSNHPTGEDGPGQRVLCSISRDGATWQKPFECFPRFDKPQNSAVFGRVLTAIAWVPANGSLYAIAEVDDRIGNENWANQSKDPNNSTPQRSYLGRYGWGRVARTVAAHGKLGPIFWLADSPPEPMKGFEGYPGARAPRFRNVAAQITSELKKPAHLPAWDFRDKTAWTRASDGHLLCEPSEFRRSDGVLVKLSRDRNGSQRLYVSLSQDGGQTWTTAEQTAIPDSPSKATSGVLPDGRVYLIGNQMARDDHARDPLMVSISLDGKTFDWTGVIRYGAPQVREEGAAKSIGFQYPSAVVARNSLWVIYSVGKEDVEVSQVPLSEIGGKRQP